MSILFLLIALYLVVNLAIAVFFAYPMRTPLFMSPGFLGASQEWVEFPDPATGLMLRGWWVACPDARGVVVCAHGYMMNRAELSPLAPRLKAEGFASFFFDFPACGGSQGKKSGLGWRERTAVGAAANWVKAKAPGVPIVLVGSSMGAAASAFAISESPEIADGLVLDSAYDQLSSAVDGWWNFLGGRKLQILLKPVIILGIPILGLNPFRIRVSDALQRVNQPTLILHGDRDTLALPVAAEANFAALKGPKTLIWFAGRNHSEARWEEPEKYFAELIKFLNGLIEAISIKNSP